MSGRKKVVVSIYIDPEQLARLKTLAVNTRITQTNYIREAIDDLLFKYTKGRQPESQP